MLTFRTEYLEMVDNFIEDNFNQQMKNVYKEKRTKNRYLEKNNTTKYANIVFN